MHHPPPAENNGPDDRRKANLDRALSESGPQSLVGRWPRCYHVRRPAAALDRPCPWPRAA
jgi:hypothetical protein